jgi:predicted DNA-binding transcriptional regulator AlpA
MIKNCSETLDKDVYSVLEFCHAHNISRGTLYNLRKAGKGPKMIKLGRRVLISKESAHEWRKIMEVY